MNISLNYKQLLWYLGVGVVFSSIIACGHQPAVLPSPGLPGPIVESPAPMPMESLIFQPTAELVNRENYAHFKDNGVKLAREHPVSTFSIDVDTGSYSNVRRFLRQGQLPVRDAVRVEEMLNYFSYAYPRPANDEIPFSVYTELAPTPWNSDSYLLHIGIAAYDVKNTDIPVSNLVFLIDVSGSMMEKNKLPLLVSSLSLLTENLKSEDRISLVVYAGAAGVVLEPTPGDESETIIEALESLRAGSSTNGGAGIRLAYAMAEKGFIKGGINRIILATDGDFNVGTVNFEALKNLAEEKRKTGISLTTLGFGSGNYNDQLMEQLADAGNGNYAYIDTLQEAKKVLVDEMSSTLHTVAKDVKIQIEFNPEQIAEYRLIGYENRILNREDFNNDKVDAGDIGAGHTVTAMYEISLVDKKGQRIDPLRYGTHKTRRKQSNNELAFVKIRYKRPQQDKSNKLQVAINKSDVHEQLDQTTDHFRFAAAVAAFGQQLRGGQFIKNFNYDDIRNLARQGKGKDAFGYRREFIKLVKLAQSISSPKTQ